MLEDNTGVRRVVVTPQSPECYPPSYSPAISPTHHLPPYMAPPPFIPNSHTAFYPPVSPGDISPHQYYQHHIPPMYNEGKSVWSPTYSSLYSALTMSSEISLFTTPISVPQPKLLIYCTKWYKYWHFLFHRTEVLLLLKFRLQLQSSKKDMAMEKESDKNLCFLQMFCGGKSIGRKNYITVLLQENIMFILQMFGGRMQMFCERTRFSEEHNSFERDCKRFVRKRQMCLRQTQ